MPFIKSEKEQIRIYSLTNLWAFIEQTKKTVTTFYHRFHSLHEYFYRILLVFVSFVVFTFFRTFFIIFFCFISTERIVHIFVYFRLFFFPVHGERTCWGESWSTESLCCCRRVLVFEIARTKRNEANEITLMAIEVWEFQMRDAFVRQKKGERK